MKDVLVMEDLDQIKCISQPYRLQILECFEGEPATAKIISEKLGEPHAKINYHIKEMLKHGILILVEEVVKLGVVEKYYKPVAQRFVVHSEAMKMSDSNVRESFNQYQLMIFDATSKAFYGELERSMQSIDRASGTKMYMLHDVYFTQEEIKSIQQRFRDIMKEYEVVGEGKREGAKRYVITSVIIPDEKE